MTPLTILIPAAGASSRMRGGDKLLEPVNSQPMLRRQTMMARIACPSVIVTLRPGDAARHDLLNGLDVTVLTVTDAASGMSASIRAGAMAAGTNALMILPADMPDLTSDDLLLMIATFDQCPDHILRATAHDGTPGHPVIFPPDCLGQLTQLTGDEGARSLLQTRKARVRLIVLPDQHALTDLDTPEDWANWRARR